MNPSFTRLTGYPADEVVGRNCRLLQGANTDRAALAEAEDARSQLRLLAEATTRMTGALDVADACVRSARGRVPGLADLCAVDLTERPGSGVAQRLPVATRDGADEQRLRLLAPGPGEPGDGSATGEVLAGGGRMLLPDVVGDVVGHDLAAAAAMGQLRGVVRSYACDGGRPGSVLDRCDQLVQGLETASMATAVCARIEPPDAAGDRLLRYANAGPSTPLLLTLEGKLVRLDEHHPPMIGAVPGLGRAGPHGGRAAVRARIDPAALHRRAHRPRGRGRRRAHWSRRTLPRRGPARLGRRGRGRVGARGVPAPAAERRRRAARAATRRVRRRRTVAASL